MSKTVLQIADSELKNTTYGVPMTSLEAMIAAASYVARNWGDYGYSIGVISQAFSGPAIFGVRHSDGSEFFVWADRYGNTGDVELVSEAS